MEVDGPPSGPLVDIHAPGIKLQGEGLHQLRREVAAIFKRDRSDFPGAQPVSFARHHIDELCRQDYFLCEKSDGCRYLLYLTHDEYGNESHYFIDRRNDYWWMTRGGLHFPTPAGDQTFHDNTLLDGELVLDTLGEGRVEPHFIVFDCIQVGQRNLISDPLSKRLGYFKESIYKPYQSLYARYPTDRPHLPFHLEMKNMQVAYGLEMIFREVIPKLKHFNDGLIFTASLSPYRSGTDQNILKWKAPEENTIDFLWRFEWIDTAYGYPDFDSPPRIGLLVYHGNSGGNPVYQPYSDMYMTQSEWDELKALKDPLDERIVEAYMDEQKRWRFFRFRDDKPHGNHVSTVNSVMDSIRDGVSKDELTAAAKSIRDNWKVRNKGK